MLILGKSPLEDMEHKGELRAQRLKERNTKVKKLFMQMSRKNPNWRTEALIDAVAKTMYLSPRTVEAILKGEGIYGF